MRGATAEADANLRDETVACSLCSAIVVVLIHECVSEIAAADNCELQYPRDVHPCTRVLLLVCCLFG